ncbi:MAG: hypothetical protein Alis3KO_11580 [Aliiglaciecola sp.]
MFLDHGMYWAMAMGQSLQIGEISFTLISNGLKQVTGITRYKRLFFKTTLAYTNIGDSMREIELNSTN